jgi:hypothetical protein
MARCRFDDRPGISTQRLELFAGFDALIFRREPLDEVGASLDGTWDGVVPI